ncbi:transglutaminase domain-containing protein [Litoricolaceae bacterium]|nr:transglutaminase domain-containing protein [Litorivicinaceae bacterium]
MLLMPAVGLNQSTANLWYCLGCLCAGHFIRASGVAFHFTFLTALGLGAGVIHQFEQWTTMSVFTAFLSQIVALKSWELRTSRDGHFAIYGALFAVFTGTLNGRMELFGALLFPQIVTALVALFYLQSKFFRFGSLRFRFLLRYLPVIGLTLLVIASLFLLFPRIGGGFLDFGFGSSRQVGLSDRVRPGDLASLAGNNDVVFRVWGDLPDTSYWRVFVMDDYQDGEWSSSDQTTTVQERLQGPLNRSIRMEIESSQFQRIPRLQWSEISFGSPGYGFTQRLDLDEPAYLEVDLSLYAEIEELDPAPSGATIPHLGSAPRLDQWVDSIRSLSLDQQVDAIGQYFRKTKTYTTTPEIQNVTAIDQLWFDVSEGYCGYFAGLAAEALMRLGYPVRLVTGFLGVDRIDGLEYALIRQQHAHAWVDVYDGVRWRALDPTTWVVQESGSGFRQSPLQAMLERRSLMMNGATVRATDWMPQSIRNALIYWARVSEYSTRFLIDNVLYFDRDKQIQLYQWMTGRQVWVIVGVLFFVIYIVFVRRRQKTVQVDPYLKKYDRLMARLDIVRAQGMLPGDEPSQQMIDERRAFRVAWLAYRANGRFGREVVISTLRELRARLREA